MSNNNNIEFIVKWQGNTFEFQLSENKTVNDLKNCLCEKSGVQPNDQKLIGLGKPTKKPLLDTKLSDIRGLKKKQKLVLIGVTSQQSNEVLSVEEALRERREQDELLRAAEAAEQQRQAEAQAAEQQRLAAEAEERQRRLQEEREEELNRRQQQQQQQNRNSLQSSFDENAFFNTSLRAVSNNDTNVYPKSLLQSLDVGDKILLPSSCLDSLVEKRMSFPIIFKLTSPRGHSTYARAVEFTAAPDTIVLSQRLVKSLELEPDDAITIVAGKDFELSPCTALQIQPHRAAWMDFDAELRASILSFALTNYATASVGTPLQVQYDHETYLFDVCAVQPISDDSDPWPGVLLLNTDVPVDVLPPLEPIAPLDALQLDKPWTGEIVASQYHHFQFKIEKNKKISIFAEPMNENGQGDCDLFVSTATKRPTADDYEFEAQEKGGVNIIISNCNDEDSSIHTANICKIDTDAEIVYIGVLAFGAHNCQVELKVSEQQQSGHSLSDVQQSANDDNNNDSDNNTTQKCPSCGRAIPLASFTLHEVGCRRNNWQCEKCNEIIHVNAREKHELVRHRQVACPLGCGITLDADVMNKHKTQYCSHRSVRCIYCPMLVPLDCRGQHQQQCGARTAKCIQCDHSAQRKYLKKHCVEAHGIYPAQVVPTMWH